MALTLLLLAKPARAQQAVALDQLVLHPGDVVKLLVWREKDLKGEFVVDPRGNVVLPLVGEVGSPGTELEFAL